MEIETDIRNDVAWLKAELKKAQAEAKSIWTRGETYGYIVGAFVLGLVIGHLVRPPTKLRSWRCCEVQKAQPSIQILGP